MSNYCFASWNISDRCNFRCAYCGSWKNSNRKKLRAIWARSVNILEHRSQHDLNNELDQVIARFLATGKAMTFGFTGGEPFLFPKFVDILARLVQHDAFRIALDTNLSLGIRALLEKVPPHKIEYIYASLHIAERERFRNGVAEFLTRVRTLLDEGYPVITNYVFYPPLIERFESDRALCLSRGVRLLPKPFKGVFEGKVYPDAYTDEQRAVILKYDPGCSIRSTYEIPDYYGRRCNAGKSLIRIEANGDITRCVADRTPLGNIYTGFELRDEPRRCIVHGCPCFSPDRLFEDSGEEDRTS